MFVYDTKFLQLITRDNNAMVIQEEPSGLYERFNKWMMQFSIDRCTFLSNDTIDNTGIGHAAIGRALGMPVSRPDPHVRSSQYWYSFIES